MKYHPSEKGYIKLNIPSTEINKVFKMRRLHWTQSFSLWYNPLGCKYLLVESLNTKARIIHTMVLPFLCLLSLVQIKDIWQGYLDSFNVLVKGKYCSDTIYPKGNNSKYWGQMRELHSKGRK